jgi:ATP phosphoribosyltransferase regulatory subunit
LRQLTRSFPAAAREGLAALVQLYGGPDVLAEARRALPAMPAITQALEQLAWLGRQLSGATVSYDLADLRGYAYYSGMRFSIYTPGAGDSLLRGGRYDEVGAVFGRNRPAVGFSLDVKELVGVVAKRPLKAAIRAPWGDQPALRSAIGHLRAAGETVVCVLPGHGNEVDEFHCDRELVDERGQWVVRPL